MKQFFLFFPILIPFFFHGDFHERITIINTEIKTYPDSSYLYLKRAKLYFQHEDFELSIPDFMTCDSLGYPLQQEIYFGLSQSYYALDSLHKAIAYADSTLKINPESVNVLRLKATIIIAQGDTCAATEALKQVLSITKKPLPINYYELSDALMYCKNQTTEDKVYEVLEKGIEQLGELPHLYKKLVDAAMHFNNHDKAILYQTKIIGLSLRKEFPTFKRALLHLKYNKKELAITDFKQVITYVNDLPEHIRNNPSVRELKHKATIQLSDLEN